MVALGFALVYNTTRTFHIAYAVLYMFCPYMFLTFNRYLNVNLFIALMLSLMCTVFLSILMELIVYRPLVKKQSSSTVILISSIAVMTIVINIIALFYGNETKMLRTGLSKTLRFSGLIFTYTQIYHLIISITLIITFLLFLKFSNFGIRARAMRDSNLLCKIFGMNLLSFRIVLFTLSGLFAGMGGFLIAYDVGMNPYIGMPMLLNAVVALIIGGVGRFEGPVLGGFLLGILQSSAVYMFSSRWQNAVTFAILILFLMFLPQGILGEKAREV